ncbi:hypothetical protein LCGC14_2275280 [marine sediment metagenome]|uniref:Uncharacterized protein n=1 Tax=marine sediment metagenome TaxID=412755 RepID=A0A0F9CVY9_9ZZZZ
MGTVTFDKFVLQTKFELGERTDLSSHSDLGDLYEDWINMSYLTLTTSMKIKGVEGQLYFPELFTDDTSQSTTDGQAYINVPSDAVYIEGVWDTTNDIELENISWAEYKERTGRADSNAETKPTEWTRRGAKTGGLYLHSTPDAIYAMTIYYYKTPTVLTGSAVTEIGPEWDEAILKHAVVTGLMKLKRYEEAAIEYKGWIQLMYGLMGMYDRERRDREEQLRIHVRDRSRSKF